MRSFKRKLPIQNKSERENALPAKIRRAFSTHSFSLPSCLYWWNRARGIRALLRTPYKRIMSSSKPSSNQATSTFQPIRILLLLSDNQWVIFAPSFSDQSGFFKNWATNECSSPSPRERENVPVGTRVPTHLIKIRSDQPWAPHRNSCLSPVFLSKQLSAPQASKNSCLMERVVSHHMEPLVWPIVFLLLIFKHVFFDRLYDCYGY